MLLVVSHLDMTPTSRLVDGDAHRIRHVVRIHDDTAAYVTCGTANGLDEASLIAQEALLVRIENRDEAHLG